MTTLPHDDVVVTAVEDAVARLDGRAATAGDRRPRRSGLAAVRPAAAVDRDATAGRDAGPRVPTTAARGTGSDRARLRLVPALADVPVAAATDAPGVPPLLRDRTARPLPVRATLTADPDDDRGAAPGTDAGRFAHGVGLACVEVVLGRRPAVQLARWVAPPVLESLQARADLVRRAGVLTHARRPAARRVRVCPIDRHTAEACLVVDDGVRVRAVALRLEAHRGSWRVTTLEIG